MKMLVNAPSGLQELFEVGAGGGYFDHTRVLWDERVDGPIPAVTIGGMVRVNNELTFDPVLLASIRPPEIDWRTPMMADLRAKRDTLLNVLDGIQADALTSGVTADAVACKNIKAALKQVPELPSVTGATSAAALKLAVVMAYQSAISGAPAGVLALFASYLK